jgi:hypothetical protein
MTWQSGAPFSILSGRGTLNRESRSNQNTADTSLTKGQLDSIVSFQMTGNGPMMITQSAINATDGTGVNTDGAPAFQGQVFSNPGAGTLGVLQRRLPGARDLQHRPPPEEDDRDHGAQVWKAMDASTR